MPCTKACTMTCATAFFALWPVLWQSCNMACVQVFFMVSMIYTIIQKYKLVSIATVCLVCRYLMASMTCTTIQKRRFA
eukprot:scaffold19757_cov19-Tisochrysis_lutea.AAC.1